MVPVRDGVSSGSREDHLSVILLGAGSGLIAEPSTREPQNGRLIYANLNGTVALENDRVLVQRFVIPPGESTGDRTRSGQQLLVFVKGGVLTSASGRSTSWSVRGRAR